MAHMETAIILAGGKSSRMGFDKQFLKLQDKYVIEIIAERLKEVFSEIIIVTGRPEEYVKYGFKLVEDEVRNFGPLAGIHVGLKNSGSIYNYVVACDMPFINLKYIRYMMQLIEESDDRVDGVITKLGDWIEPFNAFYSQNLISRIEENMKNGKRQINLMLQDANVLYVSEAKAREFSPDWEMFTNINTFKDYESLMKRLSNE
ncbi:MAG TPA: molybdenum cofactor guanylyltransferase [Bacillota bacterium]|jgi:molybdopterin-guanine dinucleotide biosynthesis protein A|nr:molybdenum cofactor guanylyltransferase [Bacillota bacterium]HQE65353.1 molybdenum cofactor guanylyltransferase [Bacillota bacterium]HQI15928.1 molybdenum cofactor guanylyltransferase [Bacillota bacterium]HQJ36955.1 molybdenum cofactor guanylyltransferase [Bacillota bacterium]HQL36124.1 molybdenum cofactor guanylyltransferase [Bacillota bacterium]